MQHSYNEGVVEDLVLKDIHCYPTTFFSSQNRKVYLIHNDCV
jgi:hypothetical protein